MKILAFDIGTSSIRAAIYDPEADFQCTMAGQLPVEVLRPEPGAAIVNPAALFATTETLFHQALALLRNMVAPGETVWVSSAAFWHSLLGVDEDGNPVTPCWTWEDTQTESAVDFVRTLGFWGFEPKTGCHLSGTFWPVRLCWYYINFPEDFARVRKWVSLPDLIMEHLGLREPGFTSICMASGTGLTRRRKNSWAPDYFRPLHLERENLPEISAAPTSRQIQGIHFMTLPPIGDGAAGTLGSGVLPDTDLLALNYGTSAAVRRMSVTTLEEIGILFEYRLDQERRIVGGAINNAGNLFEWARANLRVPEDPVELEAMLALRPGPVKNAPKVFPYWAGERTPYWTGRVTGNIMDLNFGHTALDILQAIQESTFYRLREIADELDPAQECRILASGGLGRSPAALQRLANVMARPVITAEEPELSLLGAAIFAAEHAKHRARPKMHTGPRYDPQPQVVKRYKSVFKAHVAASDAYVQRMFRPEPRSRKPRFS